MAFCKQQVITLEDVIKGNYTTEDLTVGLDQKFAITISLSTCNEKDLKVVRDFIGKLGGEVLATFDVLWSKGDEKRLEQITKLKMSNNIKII